MKLSLDLHEIYNRGDDIDRALQGVMEEAVAKKAKLVEIIPGKGSGQLKKRVLRFLDRKDIKPLYHRVEKDSHNFGRIFVHFGRSSRPRPASTVAIRAAGRRRAEGPGEGLLPDRSLTADTIPTARRTERSFFKSALGLDVLVLDEVRAGFDSRPGRPARASGC